MMKTYFSTFFVLVLLTGSYAQSPADLTSNIQASKGFFTVEDIAESFNDARRQEELQLGLAPFAIADLHMPDQHSWNYMSRDQQALFLLNDERTSRACVDYGSGPVKGLPFEGVSYKLDAVAQHHAWSLFSTNSFGHCNAWYMNCTQERIDAAIDTACQEAIPYNENLYRTYFSESWYTFPKAIAQAVYIWSYVDSHNGWENRRMSLYQGFIDNHGADGSEGIIGIGVEYGGPYNWWDSGIVITFNYYDPPPGCFDHIQVWSSHLPNACHTPLALKGHLPSQAYSHCNITASGYIDAPNVVSLNATNTIDIHSEFTVESGATLEVNMRSSCN